MHHIKILFHDNYLDFYAIKHIVCIWYTHTYINVYGHGVKYSPHLWLKKKERKKTKQQRKASELDSWYN